MIIEEIQKAIECWASRPTWFSSHPTDAKLLRQAISNLKKLEYPPSEDELAEAIYERVKDLPGLLGSPTDIKGSARKFAKKMFSKL